MKHIALSISLLLVLSSCDLTNPLNVKTTEDSTQTTEESGTYAYESPEPIITKQRFTATDHATWETTINGYPVLSGGHWSKWKRLNKPFLVTLEKNMFPDGSGHIDVELQRGDLPLQFTIHLMGSDTEYSNQMTKDGVSYTRVQRGTTIHSLPTKEERSIGDYMRGVGGWGIIDNYHNDGSIIVSLSWKDSNGNNIGHCWKCTK